MNIYSHLVLAEYIASDWFPNDKEQYYLGAVAPDMRYMCGFSRTRTHLPLDLIVYKMTQYPEIKSFLAGYYIHCAIDEKIQVHDVVFMNKPHSIVKAFMPKRTASFILELYHLENIILDIYVARQSNVFLEALGISSRVVEEYADHVNRIIKDPSVEVGFATVKMLMKNRNILIIYKYLAEKILNKSNIRRWFYRGMGEEELYNIVGRLFEGGLKKSLVKRFT